MPRTDVFQKPKGILFRDGDDLVYVRLTPDLPVAVVNFYIEAHIALLRERAQPADTFVYAFEDRRHL